MATVLDVRVRNAAGTLTRRATDAVARTWQQVPDLSDESAALAEGVVVPLIGGAQRAMAGLMALYVSQVTGMVLAVPEVATLLPEAPWVHSPIIQARRLVGEGLALAVAVDQAAARAAQVHSGDVLRARNDASTALGDGVEPLRPVRYAKLPGPNACDWCRMVATKLYYRPDGMPVHLHCRCGVQAVTPSEAGAYTNASTVFGNFRWRSRVTTAELAATQQRIAQSARELATNANQNMRQQAA